jgi:RNA 3'-terminal phosphate cyclase (ATP)
MGARVSVKLERPGFFPAGGGRLQVSIDPPSSLTPLELTARGDIRRKCARVILSHLPENIAKRELSVIEQELSWPKDHLKFEAVESSGPGNVVLIELESEEITEIFSAFGERGIPAEKVASQAVQQVRRYLETGVPVGSYLADQLLVPMVIMRGGVFSTIPLTSHTQTNMEIIKKFLSINIKVSNMEKNGSIIEVRKLRSYG